MSEKADFEAEVKALEEFQKVSPLHPLSFLVLG
jgi:hypothetical protein